MRSGERILRGRVLHHAIYRVLCPFFDTTFISDSFSCRVGEGTHKAIERLILYGLQGEKIKKELLVKYLKDLNIPEERRAFLKLITDKK